MTWRPRFGRFLRHHSLRQRYLSVAVFLGIVVVVSAALTERYVSSTGYASARNIEVRNQIQQRTRTVRNAVWGAEYALQAYVLEPAPWYREAVITNLQNARDDIALISDLPWTRSNGLQDTADQLDTNLESLAGHATELMDIRADVSQLFPSAELMDSTLSPANAIVQTAIELALREITEDRATLDNETYAAFQDIRHAWSQMISAFRLYVIRHAGIYNHTEASLEDAGHDITLLIEHTEQRVQQLAKLEQAGLLGLQASDALAQVQKHIRTWKSGFEVLHEAQKNGHWRNDIPLIQDKVQPLFAEIWNRLDRFDAQFGVSAERDVSTWTEVGQRLNNNLLLLSLLACAFIVIGFIFFQRTVLQPLSQLTHAMKAIAHDEAHERLPQANSVEAHELIDAFVHMRRMIHERQIALQHQAMHDTLTGLPNRVLIKDRVQHAVLSAERNTEARFSLLMIDLDRFKEINDTLGHQAGDHVLHEVGQRVKGLLRKSDTVARLGGDEFAVLLPDTGVQQAQELAEAIAAAIGQPLFYQDRDLPIGASIGIATYPEHGRNTDTLFRCADVAMYIAKQDNLNHAIYNTQQDPHSVGRLALISELRSAILENGLVLHYQPKLELATGNCIGVEALLRWPKWSSIPTEYLIKTAESTGLIQPLTNWVLRQALRQMAAWLRHGITMPIAVNLSTWNLSHSDIATLLETLLLEYAVPTHLVELEITENAMMKNPERAHAILDKLHALGVRLTVDDYGTGFSSLAYLKTMPVDQIKIDKSFVTDMLDDENNAVIVRSTIDLAHNLGLSVVAEGVSSAEIWQRLEMLGCDSAQGYYIARPMPAEDLHAWLQVTRNSTDYPRRA